MYPVKIIKFIKQLSKVYSQYQGGCYHWKGLVSFINSVAINMYFILRNIAQVCPIDQVREIQPKQIPNNIWYQITSNGLIKYYFVFVTQLVFGLYDGILHSMSKRTLLSVSPHSISLNFDVS